MQTFFLTKNFPPPFKSPVKFSLSVGELQTPFEITYKRDISTLPSDTIVAGYRRKEVSLEMLILFSFLIIIDTEELLSGCTGIRARSGQKTILRRCFFSEVPNSMAVRWLSGYITYRSKKLKGGVFLTFSCTTKTDSAVNQSCIQKHINNEKTSTSFT